ncbi:MAG TPA: hypothetical protein VKU19_12505 [Bryobacteraceae bacterium]|nr:hypothetical protein [Bryobacteraceae bacterium]
MRWTNVSVLGLGAVLAFGLVAQVFPQTLSLFGPSLGIPYLAENEFAEYADDGVTVVDRYFMTTYMSPGKEIVVSSFMPGHPVVTAIRRVLETVDFLIAPVADLFDRQRTERIANSAQFVSNGCKIPGIAVVGDDLILNYPSVGLASDAGPDRRMTMWYAPALGCLATRLTIEERRPDGRFVLRVLRRTVEVKTQF